jgi:hypothetical protein
MVMAAAAAAMEAAAAAGGGADAGGVGGAGQRIEQGERERQKQMSCYDLTCADTDDCCDRMRCSLSVWLWFLMFITSASVRSSSVDTSHAKTCILAAVVRSKSRLHALFFQLTMQGCGHDAQS